jgi:hypothetical protein
VGAEFLHAGGQTDRYDEAKASKNGPWRITDVTGLGNNPITVLELWALQYGISVAKERIVLLNNAVSCIEYTCIVSVMINE